MTSAFGIYATTFKPLLVAKPRRYITPNGAGNKSGSNLANAAQLGSLNTLISQAAAINGEVLLIADQGTYYSDEAISISAGGTATNPVAIRGADSAGTSMRAEIIGSRASPWSIGGANGNEVFRLNTGANYLAFQFIRFRNQGTGCVRIRQAVTNLTMEDCDAFNVRRFVENLAASGDATIHGFTMRRCEARGYSKGFARIQYNSHDILIEDCFGDSERQDKDNFAAGVVLYHTAHDIDIYRTGMNNHIDTVNQYQNGDGFSSELGVGRLRLYDCWANNNTDGGVDFKSDNVILYRFKAEGNHKNYRLWGYAQLIDCIGKNPADNAGPNPYGKANVGCFNFAMCRIIGGHYSQTNTEAVFQAEAGGIMSVSPSTVVVKPSGAPLFYTEGVNNGNPGGKYIAMNPADTTPPVITSGNSFSLIENVVGKFPITSNEVAQLRVVGGPDASSFSTFGNELRIPRQDYEDPLNTDHQRTVNVQLMDGNGNLSAIQSVTVTITNAEDDPITPEIYFAGGNATDGVWYDISTLSSLWQDTAATIPAVIDEPVARINSLSPLNNHFAWQDDIDKRAILRFDAGLYYLEFNGVNNFYNIGTNKKLCFGEVTAVAAIRRSKYDYTTTARAIFCVPRNPVETVAANWTWAIAFLGGATIYAVAGSETISSNGVGANADRDFVISLQTRTAEIRSNANLVGDKVGSVMTYPFNTLQAKLGCDGSNGSFFYGRFYGGVVGNVTNSDAIRFRLERQLAVLEALVL